MKKKLQALKYKVSNYIKKTPNKYINHLSRSGPGYLKRREGLLSSDMESTK